MERSRQLLTFSKHRVEHLCRNCARALHQSCESLAQIVKQWLTNHNDWVFWQKRIHKRLPKEHTVCKVLYPRAVCRTEVFKAYWISHLDIWDFDGVLKYLLTSSPNTDPTSCATLCAMLVAATRRGCVHAIVYGGVAQPSSYRYCGNSKEMFNRVIHSVLIPTCSLSTTCLSYDDSDLVFLEHPQQLLPCRRSDMK